MQNQLSSFEQQQAKNARHRALILQILREFPEGLTTQQIVEKEQETYGYNFLTDNRLRELRALNYVESMKGLDGLLRWRRKE
jgi:hypothetical protein